MKSIQIIVARTTQLALVTTSLVLLTGCDFLNKKKEEVESTQAQEEVTSLSCTVAGDPLAQEGTVLVTMNGKAIISDKSFDQHYTKLLNENPQYKKFLENSIEAKKNTLNGLAAQAVVDEYLCRSGIDQTQAYQDELKWSFQAQKRMINLKYFSEKLDVKITDADLKEAYEKNKEASPQLLISRGGVKAVGVAFDKEDEANAFAQKIGKGTLSDVAKTAGITDKVRDFKVVHAESFGVDPAVRDVIIAITQFPAVKVVKGKDQKFWVVQATGMEQKQYRSFEEAKEWLRANVQREKGIKAFEKELERLKNEYKIVINDGFFGASTPNEQEALIHELEQMVNQEQMDLSLDEQIQKVA